MTLARWIKICGITSPEDARLVADAGASAIGINLWPGSPRGVSLADAATIADAVRGRLEIVTVTVDADERRLREVIDRLHPDRVQLHGDEPDALLIALGSKAYKAVGLAAAADAARALAVPGELVLVDARDDVRRGGTGRAPPSSLAARVCAGRPTVLAGGLAADNVAAAIERFGPVGVDTASGVEQRGPESKGRKDAQRVHRFVAEAMLGFSRREKAAGRAPSDEEQ